MQTSESLKAGDIVIVPFPFTDRLAERRRPALIVSSPTLNSTGMIWVVMITAAKKSMMTDDFEIRDFVSAGLNSKCFVRPAKIASLETTRIVRRAGRLDDHEVGQALRSVRKFVATKGVR